MTRPLLIFGASTLARLACLAARDSARFELVGFVVDEDLCTANSFMGHPVISWSKATSNWLGRDAAMFCAVGYRRMLARADLFSRAAAAGFEMVSLISPRAHVSPDAAVGRNCFIMDGAVVEPGARLGVNNTVWSNATICHDATLGDHNFIAAGATLGGHTSVGDRSFIGFGAIVRERRRLGSDSLLGAQSCLLQDAADLGVYVGSPARRIRDLDPHAGVCIE
jgi:sugar O-acyltransferase (sialic acid O-acetyltransferase NeuD family)